MPSRHHKLTRHMKEEIISVIRMGNYREVAAEFVGIDNATFSRWMTAPATPLQRALQTEVLRAEREAEIRQVARVIRAAQDSPEHAKWWLERKFPSRWSRKESLNISASLPSVAPATLDLTSLSDDELRQLEDLTLKASRSLTAPDAKSLPPAPPDIVVYPEDRQPDAELAERSGQSSDPDTKIDNGGDGDE